MQYDLQKFCIIISELRKQKGWSQTVLAEKIGISPQSVSKWECGIGYPDVTLFPTLAEIFSVPIGVLFGEKQANDSAVGVSTKGNAFYAPDYKRIYVELGNVCRVVFVGDKEQDGLVVATLTLRTFIRLKKSQRSCSIFHRIFLFSMPERIISP